MLMLLYAANPLPSCLLINSSMLLCGFSSSPINPQVSLLQDGTVRGQYMITFGDLHKQKVLVHTRGLYWW